MQETWKLSIMFTQAQCQSIRSPLPKGLGRRVLICEKREAKSVQMVTGGETEDLQSHVHIGCDLNSVLWGQTEKDAGSRR